MESAIGLWKRMQQQGVKLSTDNCNALLTACLECQYNDRALALFRESQALGETQSMTAIQSPSLQREGLS